MHLRDLVKEESRPEPTRPVKEREAAGPPGPTGVPWVVVASRLLDGEQVLVVFEKKHLKEAEREHPDKVIYFPPEIEELRRHKGSPDFPQLLRTIHLVKKRLGGWVVPTDAPKGGGNHATGKLRGKTG